MRLHGVDAELLDREQVRALVPFLDFDNARFPIQGGLLQRARRHGAARCGGLGLCARRRPARRRHRAELRGHRLSRIDGRAVSTGVETTRGPIRARKVGTGGRRQSPRASRAMAGLRLPIESHVLQAFVSEGDQAADARRHHLRRRAFLHQPVGQGRPRVRRRSSMATIPTPSAAICRRVEDVLRRRHGADAAARPRCACCGNGAASWTCRWTARRSSTTRRSKASISMPAGATAASRRRRPRAGASPTLIARDEPHPLAAAYPARPLRAPAVDRRKGQARAPHSRICTDAENPLSLSAARATRANSSIAATRRPRARIPPRDRARTILRLRLSARQSRRASHASIWYHALRLPPLARW